MSTVSWLVLKMATTVSPDGGIAGYPARTRSTRVHEPDPPLAIAAAVKCDSPAIRRPRELLRGRIRQHAAHRTITQRQQPPAGAADLENDVLAIGRDRGRAHEP